MKLSVVILNYNGAQFLEEVLGSVITASIPDMEIIVVDNASTDNSLEILKSYPEPMKLIVNKKNLGFAEGNNVGIRESVGDYVFLLNNDAKIQSEALRTLVDFMDENSDFAAVQPKILSWTHPEEFEYAGGSGGFIDKYGYPFARGRILYNVEKDHGQYDDNIELFWASGAALLFRRALVDQVGLLDADFFLHQEEIDFCWRLHLAGYKVGFIGSAVVYHHGGGSLGYESPFKLYLNYRNNLNMLIKNLQKRSLLRILFLRVLLDAGAFLFKIMKFQFGHAWAIIKGYADVVHLLPQTLSKQKKIASEIAVTDNESFRYLVYHKSLILSYFLKNKKTFSALMMPLQKIQWRIGEKNES